MNSMTLTPSHSLSPEDQRAAFLLFVPPWLRSQVEQFLDDGCDVQVESSRATGCTIYVNGQPFVTDLTARMARRTYRVTAL